MNKRHQEALGKIGITIERYYVGSWPPVWGIALVKDEREVAVIETHGLNCDSASFRSKYVLRFERAKEGTEVREADGFTHRPTILAPELAICRTQREAVAVYIDRYYARPHVELVR
jgi:hypothetical protein